MKKSKKVKKDKPGIGGISSRHDRKTYKELKREAVIRGMPFPDVVEAGVPGLIRFIDNSTNKPDLTLIDKFDEWADKQLEACGYPPNVSVRSPILRLGFIGEKDDDGNVIKIKKIKGLKKPKKEKRQRDENNLVKGTKKSLTFDYAMKGFTLERTMRRVLKQYPDASEKSMNIWYRNALRLKKKQDAKG